MAFIFSGSGSTPSGVRTLPRVCISLHLVLDLPIHTFVVQHEDIRHVVFVWSPILGCLFQLQGGHQIPDLLVFEILPELI